MTDSPSQPPDSASAPEGRDGCASALLMLLGLIMLLPGICSIGFMIVDRSLARDVNIVTLWIVCLVISSVGVYLFYAAKKARKG
jgi:uncharacterized membrane protein HdeD (DUF308 family)